MADTLGIGVIGCGNISAAYMRLAPLFKGIEMRACADLNEEAAKARAEGGVSDDQMVGDAEGAVQWIRAQHFCNGKVGVIGSCSGGRQAFLYACKSSSVDACVDLVERLRRDLRRAQGWCGASKEILAELGLGFRANTVQSCYLDMHLVRELFPEAHEHREAAHAQQLKKAKDELAEMEKTNKDKDKEKEKGVAASPSVGSAVGVTPVGVSLL